jgi:hypothetical protein
LITDIFRQPIDPIFKGQAFQEECQATGDSILFWGMVWVVTGSWGGKEASQVAGA